VAGVGMAFVVQGKSDPSGEGLFRAEKATRKDAVKTAVDLLAWHGDGHNYRREWSRF
jgi:hypothetical protein